MSCTHHLENGGLVELYFRQLMKNIFGDSAKFPEGEGEPDSIIDTDNYTLIFEFTVEYYKIASLYDFTVKPLHKDLEKILFNKSNKNKKDSGKYIKLDNYIKKYNKNNKTIIPILVTEKYLGDDQLLMKSGFDIKEKAGNFDFLSNNLPIIICLDDLEIFWKLSRPSKAVDDLIYCISKWKEERKKERYFYRFDIFIHELLKERIINKDYSEFFDIKNFHSNIKESSTPI